MPRTMMWTFVIAVAPVWAQTDPRSPVPPPTPSISSAFAYLERAETQLRRLAFAESGTSVRTVDEYAKEISRFHVELGRLRADKDEREFIADSLARLRLQALELEQLAEKAHFEERFALNGALSHIRSAIELSEIKLGRSRSQRWLRFRFGEPAPAGYGLAPSDAYASRPPK